MWLEQAAAVHHLPSFHRPGKTIGNMASWRKFQ
jgi:hypothetical protein